MEKFNVKQLREELIARGLSAEGNKGVLLQRLLADTLKGNTYKSNEKPEEDERMSQVTTEVSNREHVHTISNGKSEQELSEEGKETLPKMYNMRFTIRDIVNMLPDFDPTDGTGLNSDQWVRNVEVMMDVYQLDERLVILAARSKMLKYALKWYEAGMDRTMTWDRFSWELRDNFPSKCTQAELHEQLRKRIRGKQGLVEYFFEMCHIAKGQMEEENIIYYIIMGVNEYRLSQTLKSIKITTLRELKEHIEWHVKMHGGDGESGRRGNGQNYPAERVKTSENNQRKYETSENNQKKYESKPEWIRKRECYNCFQQGHIATNCPLPRRKLACERCKKIGHAKEQCKVKLESETLYMNSQTSDMEAEVERQLIVDSSGQVNAMAVIGGKCVEERVLIDSGSNVSIIKERLVRNLEVGEMNNESVFGINGSALIILGIYDSSIIIEGNVYKVKYRVVPDKTMDINIILGRDFLKLNGIGIVKIGDVKKKSSFDMDIMKEVLGTHSGLMVMNEVVLDVGDTYETVSHSGAINNIYKEYYLSKGKDVVDKVQYQAEIRIRENKVVTASPKRFSYYESAELKKLTDELLESGVIRTSESPYSSRVVLVRKRDNNYRMCINYRPLNKIVERIYFPMPVIEDVVQRMSGKKYFSTLDLRNGFYHVDLKEESKKYTAFVTDQGQFEFNKLPFGYTNSPAHFVKYIQLVLEPLRNDNRIIVFIDDILVATENLEEHLSILKKLFGILARNAVKLHVGKCHFVKTKIEYLGYNVSSQGITLSDRHIESITRYPVPTDARALQRFVGLVSYFRKFIKGFSGITASLYELLKPNVEFEFKKKHVEAFNQLKKLLVERPVLSIYSADKETQLHTDASSSGYGAILIQKQEDGQFHPVMFHSRKTTDAEAKLHSFELETLALVYSIKRFRPYLFGRKFVVVTDCNALRLTLNKRDMNSKIERWALFLEEFDFEVIHRAGDKMKHVDALSRAQVYYVETEEKDLFLEKIYIRQLEDEDIQKIKRRIVEQTLKGYELRDGIVYRKDGSRLQLLVPENMVQSLIYKYHDTMGHMGSDKSCELIRRQFYFKNMKERLMSHIKDCIVCIAFNPKPVTKEALLHSVDKGNSPFETLHVDHLGPMEKTSNKSLYVLLAVDAFTKYIKLFPTRTTNTTEVCKHLLSYFSYFSVPKVIVSDRGTAFTSKEFAKFVSEKGIVHVKIATASPNSNGQVERYNRVLVPLLAKLTYEEGSQWDRVLGQAEYILNNTLNKAINEVPSKVLFGVIQRNTNMKEIEGRCCGEEDRDITRIRDRAKNSMDRQQEYNKKYYDGKVRKLVEYEEGDLVMLRENPIVGVNNKLRIKFKGPYKVGKVLDRGRYLIKDVDGYQVSGRTFEGIFDSRNMRLYSRGRRQENMTPEHQLGRECVENDEETECGDVEYLDSEYETEYLTDP